MLSTESKADERVTLTETIAPLLLTPSTVLNMLEQREKFQIVKFRTTCTDCLPNY